MYQQPNAPMNPQIQAKFQSIDTDRSGKITVDEIARVYQQIRFPPTSAKMLLNAVSDLPYVDINAFPLFDNYVNSFWGAFAQVSQGQQTIQLQQVHQALQMLSFQIQPQNLQALVQKYDSDKRGVEFGEFMAICAYLLVTFKVMQKFDQQRQNKLTVDMNGLQMLGLWFL